jgi:replicative superfamily II helicase
MIKHAFYVFLQVSLIIVDELQVMDTAVETIVSRVRAPEICNNVRLIGLSRTTLTYANDIARFLGVPPNSPQGIYNFGCASDTSISEVQVVAFAEKQYTARMLAMLRAVGDTIQENLQPKECACVLVPTQRQVILTAQMLKERVANSSNPHIWLQCQEKQDTKDVACAQDEIVQEMLKHGIGVLHSRMSETDHNIVQDLASSQKIRVSCFLTIVQTQGMPFICV